MNNVYVYHVYVYHVYVYHVYVYVYVYVSRRGKRDLKSEK